MVKAFRSELKILLSFECQWSTQLNFTDENNWEENRATTELQLSSS